MSIVNKLWIEKYKPSNLQQFIGLSKAKVLSYITKQNVMRNILIYSNSHGTGKTLLSRLISKEFFPAGNNFFFNMLQYKDEDKLLEQLELISKALILNKTNKTIIALDNFNTLSKSTQEKISVMAETYQDTVLYIFVADNLTNINSKIKNDCMKLNVSDPFKEEIKEKIMNILHSEGMAIESEYIDKFIEYRYPNIKGMILDLQEMVISNITPDESNYKYTTDIYLTIYEHLIKEKDWEVVAKLLKDNRHNIDRRLLNKFIWRKAMKSSNVRIIQLTELNENKMINGDPEIIFDSSLIELVK